VNDRLGTRIGLHGSVQNIYSAMPDAKTIEYEGDANLLMPFFSKHKVAYRKSCVKESLISL